MAEQQSPEKAVISLAWHMQQGRLVVVKLCRTPKREQDPDKWTNAGETLDLGETEYNLI